MALQFNKYILQMKPSASMETMAKAKKLKAQDPERRSVTSCSARSMRVLPTIP